MKRSQVNQAIRDAEALMEQFHFKLPRWGKWSKETWQKNSDLAAYNNQYQLGWDVTDFNEDRFDQRGLVLFCIRNGDQSDKNSVPYAEKIMMVKEEQETPLHYHKKKVEDIINRGGGNLVVECVKVNGKGEHLDKDIKVTVDGEWVQVKPFEPIILSPGQSIRIPTGLMHRFYGEKGKGPVLTGEVSMANDDNGDNYFDQPLGRFSDIIEDEPAIYPLWNELK